MPPLPLCPGELSPPASPLARYRAPHLRGVLEPLLRAASAPGDLVLLLGAHEPAYIREAAVAGRRVVGLNVNPIPLLWMRGDLHPAPPKAVQTALTRLGDRPKGERPFINHVRALYRSRCPTCQQIGTAEYFAWDRDTRRPFAKRVRCPRCAEPQEGPVDSQDLAALDAFTPRGGPAYHIALGRATSEDDPLRERAAELVDLYTPRNLSVLMDLLHRLPRPAPAPEVGRALNALMLETLDRASSLISHDAPSARPRSLRPPQRYREHNVWLIIEEAMAAYAKAHRAHAPALLPEAPSLHALLENRRAGYALRAQSIREVAQNLPPHSVDVLMFEIHAPDAPFWALSALWASWLWREEEHSALHSFLGRRRLDWDWYRRSIGAALESARPLLKPGAPLLLLWPHDDPAPLPHLARAAAEAGFAGQRWIACPPLGYRLVFAAGPPTLVQRTREETWRTILTARGEPTPATVLDAAHALDTGTTPKADEPPGFASFATDQRWFAKREPTPLPLADRVEKTALHLLQKQHTWDRVALEAEIYARFSGALSPEPALIAACLAAYTQGEGEIESRDEAARAEQVTLRREDYPRRRRAELRRTRVMLRTLGRRLGYRVSRIPGRAVVWRDRGKPAYHFHCTGTAEVAPTLLNDRAPKGARRCWVLPGGRASLLAHKLHRDPRLQAASEQRRWVFIKFRHLRKMATEVRHRSEIEVYLGLDPIIEQESAQIPLPLEIEPA